MRRGRRAALAGPSGKVAIRDWDCAGAQSEGAVGAAHISLHGKA